MATGYFLFSNVLAGVLNYLFQLVAAKQLSALDYSDFNSWLAHVSFLAWISGLVQFTSGFSPASSKWILRLALVLNVLCLATLFLTWSYQITHPQWLGAFVIFNNMAIAWFLGQAQNRLMFFTLGTSALLVAIVKFASIFIPLSTMGAVDRYIFIVFVSIFPSLWLTTYLLCKDKSSSSAPAVSASTFSFWLFPVVMAVMTALTPQQDFILLRHTQTDLIFAEYSRGGIFARGIFFVFLIFAQWLLPFQLRGQKTTTSGKFKNWMIVVASLLTSIAFTAAMPIFNSFVLKWEQLPNLQFVFLSCLNMCLLTWFYILLQELCAQRKKQLTIVICAGVTLHFVLQWVLGLAVLEYFILSLGFYSLLITYLLFKVRNVPN